MYVVHLWKLWEAEWLLKGRTGAEPICTGLGRSWYEINPFFFPLMLHTDPVLVPFFFCLSCLCQFSITIFSIIALTPNCSSIVPSATSLEGCLCPREPRYSNVRQATAEALSRWTWTNTGLWSLHARHNFHPVSIPFSIPCQTTFSIPWSGSDSLFKHFHSSGWKCTTFLVFSSRKHKGVC